MNTRICLIVLLFSATCPRLFAQSTANPPSTDSARPKALENAVTTVAVGQKMEQGASLLQATLAAPAEATDPAMVKAKLSVVSYFAVAAPEPRTMMKHDLVTIVVREQSELSIEGTTDLKKNADINAKIEQYLALQLSPPSLEGKTPANPLQLKASGQRNFKGEATVENRDSFTTRLTAEVVDVKPNGNLVLQARKHIKDNDEEQEIILSGTCRAQDITPDNTVFSTQLYDLDVRKTTKGAASDTMKRGWIPKLLDRINPF